MNRAMTDALTVPEIEWDDGYPTDASLKAFQAVDWLAVSPAEGARVIRRELAECAAHCCASYREEEDVDFSGRRVLLCRFSTGGWSGAEDLIDAMLAKYWIKYHHIQWNRGGHYVFEVPHD